MESLKKTGWFSGLNFVAIVLITLIVSPSLKAQGPDDFVTTWKTNNPGSSDDTSITVPMQGGPYSVDWNNDGVFDVSGINGPFTHDFGFAGTFTIRINGFYDVIQFGLNADALKLVEINQWGTRAWTTMQNAFFGARNLLVPATDTPNFTVLTSLLGMFTGAVVANPNTSNWDTSNVTTMSNMFRNASKANPDTSNWDTSKVESMQGMFYNADSANPDTSNWDTTMVKQMGQMFARSDSANPDTSNWDTGAVEGMFRMFNAATMAKPVTSNWNTANVLIMAEMFKGATSANPDVSNWNTAMVDRMDGMFEGATSANPDVSNWNTAMVVNMESMFEGATAANPNVHDWNTFKVTNMKSLFKGATAANPEIKFWITHNVTDMSSMFASAILFDRDISGWQLTALLDAADMLKGVKLSWTNYDKLLIVWSGQSLKPNVVFGAGESQFCSELAVQARAAIIADEGWEITDGGMYIADGVQEPCVAAAGDFVTTWKTDNPGGSSDTDIRVPMLGGPYDIDWDNDGIFDQFGRTDVVHHSYGEGAQGVYTVRIRGTYDSIRFGGSSASDDELKLIEINQWGGNGWTTMFEAFSLVTNVEVPAKDTPDFSAVATMYRMFNGAVLANPDTSNWNTAAVTNMRDMFRNAASANPDVTGWDTSKVETTNSMFEDAVSFDRNIGSWNVSSLASANRMFRGVTLSTHNYDALLIGWNAQVLKKDVHLGAGESRYCSDAAIAARTNMSASDDWTFSDGGVLETCPDSPDVLFRNGFEDQ